MKSQLELIKEIVKLAEENPSYEIHFAVSNEELADGAWTDHEIESVGIDWMWRPDDVIFTGREEIEEEYEEVFEHGCIVENIHSARKVILVRTEPYLGAEDE